MQCMDECLLVSICTRMYCIVNISCKYIGTPVTNIKHMHTYLLVFVYMFICTNKCFHNINFFSIQSTTFPYCVHENWKFAHIKCKTKLWMGCYLSRKLEDFPISKIVTNLYCNILVYLNGQICVHLWVCRALG